MKVKIGDICQIYSGGDKPIIVSEKRTETCCFPIYGNALDNEGLYGYTNFSIISNNAITISARGSNCGVSFYRTEPYVPIVRLLSLITDENIVNSEYLYYVIKNQPFKSTGSGQPQITIPQVSECVLNIYDDINLQRKIAKTLSVLDKKIKNNNRINAELEAMAKTIYDYWFLQFEFPNEEGKPYKSSGGKMVWNEELKREIPEGWEVGSLINNPFTKVIKPGVEFFDNKNYLATSNINGTQITDGDWISFDNRESRANMQPVKNSIWFAKMKNSIKHLTLPENADWFVEKYILSTGFFGISCNNHVLSYLHCFINDDRFENLKDTLSHGATQEAVNNEDLKNVKLLLPLNKVLVKFNDLMSYMLEKQFNNIRENQELSSLRDFLLPLLMNGQVAFKD